MVSPPLRLCLFGAALDTGNKGVEALGRSVLAGVARSAPGSSVTVFDNGWGVRSSGSTTGRIAVEHCGVRRSRRWHRRESWWNVRASQHLGGAGNPAAARLAGCDAVLDVSGGDSFSDIYGMPRLRTVLEPKRAALRARRPLVLLPQTFGPFTDPVARRLARDVLLRTGLAYSRDADSHAALLEVLGPDADAARYRQGVDLAFGLAPREASRRLPATLAELLDGRSQTGAIAGVNVSGLLWDRPAGPDRFGLSLDYRGVHTALVTGLLAAGAEVVLVPHVVDVAAGRESDRRAAVALREALPARDRARVHVAPDDLAADEAKWVISTLDWFCGTRMHATIAGLSTTTPTAAVAYSMKTGGVFATCGVGDQVVDARRVGTDDAARRLLESFAGRDDTRRRLAQSVPPVVERASEQLREIVSWVADRSGRVAVGRRGA